MDEGLIFWLIIFAVAVLQGIGQKKKKPGQPGGKPQGRPRPRPVPSGEREKAGASRRPTPSARPTAADSGQREADDGGEASSEGMIPEDVWAEILGLARGEPRREPRQPDPDPPPREEPSTVVASREDRPPPDRPIPEERAFPTSHGANAALHQTKPGGVRSRSPLSETSPEVSPEASAGRGGAGLRTRLFGSGSAEELKKAFILQEVLGAPLALKEEGE